MDTHIAAGWPKILGLLLLSLCPVTATADTPATELSPYEATYRTKAMGMTMAPIMTTNPQNFADNPKSGNVAARNIA